MIGASAAEQLRAVCCDGVATICNARVVHRDGLKRAGNGMCGIAPMGSDYALTSRAKPRQRIPWNCIAGARHWGAEQGKRQLCKGRQGQGVRRHGNEMLSKAGASISQARLSQGIGKRSLAEPGRGIAEIGGSNDQMGVDQLSVGTSGRGRDQLGQRANVDRNARAMGGTDPRGVGHGLNGLARPRQGIGKHGGADAMGGLGLHSQGKAWR